MKSRKQIAKEMLADIRQAFAESGISEEEFLEEGRRIREEPAVNSLAPIDATGRRGRHGGE
ncbi:MAG: hypothetical protein NTZ05_09365 [Chloroflexi bacterium]|nr:hypothetical protein [Chloroflexota bacterium]